MNDDKSPEISAQLSEEDANQLLRSLLHKEGNWVYWGKTCHQLQKAGYNGQFIFEQTGFQAVQQNLIVVAAQVYESLLNEDVSEEVLAYYLGPKSDVLYEFRILNQEQRAVIAQLAYSKNLDNQTAKEVAKAFQEFSRLSQLPSGFIVHPGDAIAYQCWKQARQKRDLSQRTRLIAKGLKFAHSATAREAIEKLLSDFTIIPETSAPLIPLHRLEVQEEICRIIPVVGTLPLTKNDLEGVKTLNPVYPFHLINYSGTGSVIPLPGWRAVLKAQDPVGILCMSDQLPKDLTGNPEEVLILVDRQINQWNANSYFLIEEEGQLTFKWFEEMPSIPLLGQIVIVVRPKKVFDENNILEAWQMDD
ncbi:RuBisCO accumulation factor 1 [Aphanothece sacrum]|uniref:RuBisCO accumulation factor 1 n=1 Tax=Aphanothece sacrum FPU1 TaxID=1920663 RepID=A0A401IMP6_APHSA|nr:RuBisCO accumulation factor 1 [Aphanothece sacrum]GBF82515.1 hypothetical protein AsFPU1_3945 [Aphanothece sacrum FPU1]GBF85751.1 hypothetical protein AsFPU3_2816 [Aphanothece sacrum FPU3]